MAEGEAMAVPLKLGWLVKTSLFFSRLHLQKEPSSDPNSGQAKRKVVAPDSKSSVSKDANLPVYVCEARPCKRSCALNRDCASFLSGHQRLAPKDGDQERLVSSLRLLAFSVKRRVPTSFRELCKSTGW